MKRSFQAIVVGAGPAGASAALTMARATDAVALVNARCGKRDLGG